MHQKDSKSVMNTEENKWVSEAAGIERDLLNFIKRRKLLSYFGHVGRDGALVESITFNQRVVGSTPALVVT